MVIILKPIYQEELLEVFGEHTSGNLHLLDGVGQLEALEHRDGMVFYHAVCVQLLSCCFSYFL